MTNLVAAFTAAAGCAVLTGEPGEGKSHVTRAVAANLHPECRCLGFIDLSQVVTSRQLFLAAVAQLSGIDVGDLVRQFTVADSKRVFSKFNGVDVPEDVTAAVLSVLTSRTDEFTRSEIDQVHLNTYLSLVAGRSGSGPRLLIVHNLDRTRDDVLEYLHAAVPLLNAEGVSVLLEITVNRDSQMMSGSRWKAYRALFERAATLGCFELPAFTVSDAVDLLLQEMPGLGSDRARLICERIGTRPLFLQHAALWLKQRRVVEERAHGTHLVEKPEIFFEGLRPEACISILDRHIDLWRRELELPYADAIAAATMLNGELPAEAAKALLHNTGKPESLLDSLVATGLFLPQSGLSGVRVSHSLLLERMSAMELGQVAGYSARHFDRARVARVLLSVLENLSLRPLTRELYRSALLEASADWVGAWESAAKAGRALHSEYQLAAAAEAFLRCVNVADKMSEEGHEHGPLRRIDGLVHLLRVESERYRLALPENSRRLDTLSVCLRTSHLPIETRDETLLQERYLRWRANFIQERFEEALPIARELFKTVPTKPGINVELAGDAVAALGITLKAVEQTEASKLVFDQGVSAFPESITCRMERWSNLAAIALRREPHLAIQYLRRILSEVGEKISLLDRIHTEVDVAMALFLAKEPGPAADQAARSIRIADANGIPAQAARARNILGCVHWSADEIEDAIAFLDRAILDAERSYMERFLWRFRVNLASVAAEAGRLSLALASARWAEDRLVTARAGQWPEIAKSSSHVTSRWYVALLSLGLTYQRCGAPQDLHRLGARLNQLPHFQRHLKRLLREDFPSAIFRTTTHCHSNRIMITG